jgi:hypothetical protein
MQQDIYKIVNCKDYEIHAHARITRANIVFFCDSSRKYILVTTISTQMFQVHANDLVTIISTYFGYYN